MNVQLAAVTAMALRRMPNFTLAAANNGITGFGKVPNGVRKDLLDADLINDDGTPKDSESLLAALSLVINERVEMGMFN